MEFSELVKTVGPTAAVALIGVVVLWRVVMNFQKDAVERERKLELRMTESETFIRERLIGVVETATMALISSTKALDHNSQIIEKLLDRMGDGFIEKVEVSD